MSRSYPGPENASEESETSSDSELTRQSQLAIGETIEGKYKIEARIGSGGMGVVYKGVHLLMDRPIAIKILHSHLVDSEEFLRRFKHEARIASRLRHGNAVLLYDYGVYKNVPYLIMEYCPGKTLKEVIVEGGALSAVKLNHLVKQLCAVLAEAHSLGIVHRDLKPENIILPEGWETTSNLRVLDFGIAKLLAQSGEVAQTVATQAGMFFGTPGYAAPEQVINRPIDNRSDIYSLGVVFYEVLSGTLPFSAPSLMELLLKHVNQIPSSLRKQFPTLGITSAVDAVVLRCLEKDPLKRYQSVDELARAFDAATNVVETQSKPKLNLNWLKLKWKLPKGSGFLLTIALLIGLIMLVSDDKDKTTESEETQTTITSTTVRASVATAIPTAVPTAAPNITPTVMSTVVPTEVPSGNEPTVEPTPFGNSDFNTVYDFPTTVPTAVATFEAPIYYDGSKADLNAKALAERGQQLYASRRYSEAIPVFEQALALDPNLTEARLSLGTCYLRVGRKSDSEHQYQQVLMAKPRHGPAYFELACLYALSGRKSEALNSLLQAIRIDPRFREAAIGEEDLSSSGMIRVFFRW